MMLEHMGEQAAAADVIGAITRVLAAPDAPRTPDLGGTASTSELGLAISSALSAQ
jgi:tartrate dehydrogenase/decarboxylase/D-malate dehydrogenase